MTYFKNFTIDNNIELFSVGGTSLFSYIDLNGQEWLISGIKLNQATIDNKNFNFKKWQEDQDYYVTFTPPKRQTEICVFTATNGAGIVDKPIKGNRDDLQFIAPFRVGVEVIKKDQVAIY